MPRVETKKGDTMKYKLCIFDLDGTTADSVGAIAYTANQCLEFYGLKPNPVEDYKFFAGEGQFELIKRALIAAGDSELKLYDQVMSKYIELFETGCTYQVTSFPGVLETLEKLKENGIKIAILSNKHHKNTMKVVEKIYGIHLFDSILGQKETHKRKPSPEGVFLLLEEFQVKPEECLFIGDTGTDMETGKNAGVDTVGITWGFRSKEELIMAQATYVIDEPKEIFKLL